jgi:hypothetical protein
MAGGFVVKDLRDRPGERSIISSIKVSKENNRWWLTIWNRGGQAGIIIVDAVDAPTVINKLIPPNRQKVEKEE